MRIIYTGPFDAVEIPVLGTVIERDAPTEVPDEIGQQLCEQSDWRVDAPKRRSKENE